VGIVGAVIGFVGKLLKFAVLQGKIVCEAVGDFVTVTGGGEGSGIIWDFSWYHYLRWLVICLEIVCGCDN
jgi:hypothetical protein